MAKQPRVWDGSQWQELAVTLPDLSNYSTTTQMNTAIDNAKGLVLINKTDFTTAANVTVDNVFSSTYDNYKILIQFTAFSAADQDVYYYGRSGSPATDTTANYNTQSLRQTGTTVAGANLSSSRIGTGTSGYPTFSKISLELFAPNLASRTVHISETLWLDSIGTPQGQRFAGFQDSTTQFTGIKVFPGSGTFSGTIRIYGYRNS